MAEVAELHVEHMISELEFIRKLNLCSQLEIFEIIKKRKEYEYKIERPKKEKQDFLNFINYEIKLIRTIKLRREKSRNFNKKDEIEYALTKRVSKLYKMALLYFKSDVKLWMSYINFCTQTRFVNAVSEAFGQMLQVHNDKIHLWRSAAKWELQEMNSIEGALSILQNGLHYHPNSKELYTEAFNVELMSAVQKNENDKTKQEKAIARAEVNFKTSLKSVGNDVEYIIDLLQIASNYKCTEKLQKSMIDYMIENCWQSELMWHTMAIRELQGLHYDENKTNQSRTLLCLRVYQSAIKVLPTPLMWDKYLETLTELYNKKSSRKPLLEEALKEAHKLKCLTEKHYKVWIDLYPEDYDKQLEILVSATAAVPNSVDVWVLRLQLHIHMEHEEKIFCVSQEAIKLLNEKSLPVYKLLIQHYTLNKPAGSYFTDLGILFEEGITKESGICIQLRPIYLEWLCLTKNLKMARSEYERIAYYTPYCLELHKKMIYLEKLNPGPISDLTDIYELACNQFGESRTDVWLDYIKYAMTVNPEVISQIYNSAKSVLHKNLVATFVSEFALINTSGI